MKLAGVQVILFCFFSAANAGLPKVAKQHEMQLNIHRETHRSKRSAAISCRKCHTESYPAKLPDPDSCDNYYLCANASAEPELIWCGRSDTFTPLWYDDAIKACKDVHLFTVQHQRACFIGIGASGTTPNLKEVFIGRCLEYQSFQQPQLFADGNGKDCNRLYKLFSEAFANKPWCGNVAFGSYEKFLEAADLSLLPRNELIFWSSMNEFSQEYSSRGRRGYTLEQSLLGFLLNELTWCGKEGGEGIEFETCPPWGVCEDHPMVAFWEEASTYFGAKAKNRATLMLNGSSETAAFRPWSFFASFELPELANNVKNLKVYVVQNPGLPIRETCNNGSLLLLKDTLDSYGVNFLCQDNPADVLHLLCVDTPGEKLCKSRIRPQRKKKSHKVTKTVTEFESSSSSNSSSSSGSISRSTNNSSSGSISRSTNSSISGSSSSQG